MSARRERDQLVLELEAARKRIADLEATLLRRGRDTLTTVLRVEAFREQLIGELQRTRRRGLQGALVVLQVDRIADVHRDHGFAVGDEMLSALVESLRAGTRAEDVIGRTGDDRFALMLREAGEGATSACVGRLLGDLQKLEVGPLRGISASAGVALFGAEDDDPVALFDTAGQALADAQAAGGGRAVIAAGGGGDGDGLGVSAELHRRDAVEALAIALLERDRYTGEHSESVVEMAVAVARGLGLSLAQIEDVRAAALLHDIGKVGIPDAILNKPGPLTPDERTVMAEHPVIGERILRGIGGFAPVADIVRHEHESFDGSGYPDGLAGADIPIGSRIILACDAYHAMTSDRPYRSRMSHEDAFRELRRCTGRQFDPQVTAALVSRLYQQRAGRTLLAVWARPLQPALLLRHPQRLAARLGAELAHDRRQMVARRAAATGAAPRRAARPSRAPARPRAPRARASSVGCRPRSAPRPPGPGRRCAHRRSRGGSPTTGRRRARPSGESRTRRPPSRAAGSRGARTS